MNKLGPEILVDTQGVGPVVGVLSDGGWVIAYQGAGNNLFFYKYTSTGVRGSQVALGQDLL